MPSLHDVKTRRTTVSTIRKITKAMELVATSKIKKAKRNFDQVSAYSSRIEEVFQGLDQKVKNWNEILKFDDSQPNIYIVITSDLGMCGAYNSNIIRLAKSVIKPHDKLIILGTKGIKILENFFDKSQILQAFDYVGDEPNYEVVDKIIDQLTPMIYEAKLSSIHILNTKYINSITYIPEDKIIFPIPKKEIQHNELKNQLVPQNVEFEPNPEVVLKNALPLYLGAVIYVTMASSKVSEMSSRRAAMESSSDNALEIINELEKQYNKIRQSKITQEITEIISGAQND